MLIHNPPGHIRGKHHSSYYEQVYQLKHEKKLEDAISLLLEIVDATEAENNYTGIGVAPAGYEQLAIIYRKQKDYAKEVEILERYLRNYKDHIYQEAHKEQLQARLEKAKQLLSKS